jgi:hypothetical protein
MGLEKLELREVDDFVVINKDGSESKLDRAKVDTGADVTIGGPEHKSYLYELETLDSPIKVRVADGQAYLIKEQGKMDVRINDHRTIHGLRVYVCDEQCWRNFLLGRDEIRRHNLL